MTMLNQYCRNGLCFIFFFNDTATTEIYTLSLHDALPIWSVVSAKRANVEANRYPPSFKLRHAAKRSEEHTSELQSRLHLVCRLLLEKKKKTNTAAKPIAHPASTPSPFCMSYAACDCVLYR